VETIMNSKIKTALLTAAALVMTAGVSVAAPNKHYNHNGYGKPGYSKVNPYERSAIANARAKVASVKARAWRDGRVTFLERVQINSAERQLAATIARARRT
jgi:hypothetical protein